MDKKPGPPSLEERCGEPVVSLKFQLPESDKMFLDRTATIRGISTAEYCRRVIKMVRLALDPEGVDLGDIDKILAWAAARAGRDAMLGLWRVMFGDEGRDPEPFDFDDLRGR